MAGRPETAAILAALQATRANARERQDELERKIREEARSLRQGAAAGAGGPPNGSPAPAPACSLTLTCKHSGALCRVCARHHLCRTGT
jgi:hypothetical protein